MGAEALSKRDKNWQEAASITGKGGEKKFVKSIAPHLPGHYEIRKNPPKIPCYSKGHGVELDSVIINHNTGKHLLVEVKTGNRGGNATEERAAKYLSSGLKRAIREQYDTPEHPVFFVFAGNTFNGEDGKLTPFDIFSKEGKKTTVKPKLYREKVALILEGENYAIMDLDYGNAEEVARQIMEIV